MRKQRIAIVLLAVFTLLTGTISSLASATLAKPTAQFPVSWRQDSDISYPNFKRSQHDPAGAGRLLYVNQDDATDFVCINYENALGRNYSNSDLMNESFIIYQKNYANLSLQDSGVRVVSGASAGFRIGYDEEANFYVLELVFVKNNYYVAVSGHWTGEEAQVMSLVESINVGSSVPASNIAGGIFRFQELVIGILIVATVLSTVFLFRIMRRRKS